MTPLERAGRDLCGVDGLLDLTDEDVWVVDGASPKDVARFVLTAALSDEDEMVRVMVRRWYPDPITDECVMCDEKQVS